MLADLFPKGLRHFGEAAVMTTAGHHSYERHSKPKSRRPQRAKAVLRKRNDAEGIIRPDFKLYNKAIVMKTVRCWHKSESTDQLNETESPKMNAQTHGQLTYD